MGGLLRCTERLSYILSQDTTSPTWRSYIPSSRWCGRVHPNEAVSRLAAGEAIYLTASTSTTWITNRRPAPRCATAGCMAGESPGVVVVPAMRASATVARKLRDFVRDGGMVINIGPPPEASKRRRQGRAPTNWWRISSGRHDRVFREPYRRPGDAIAPSAGPTTRFHAAPSGHGCRGPFCHA